jgi:DNA-binding NarL/FixJ family response regulator
MHILIIDDHPLTCQGLAALLSSSTSGAFVEVHSLHTTAAARQRLAEAPAPDWLFLDIQLPDDPQRSFFHELCASPWAARTVLISAEVPQTLLRQALGAGMRGFIPKSADPAMVLAGFAAVCRGEVYLPMSLAAPRAARNHPRAQPLTAPARGAGPGAARRIEQGDRARIWPVGVHRQGVHVLNPGLPRGEQPAGAGAQAQGRRTGPLFLALTPRIGA